MHTFDLVLERIVTDGPYQYLLLLAGSFWGFFAAMHVILSAFLVPPQVDFECQVAGLINSSWTKEQQRNFSLPWQDGNFSKCFQLSKNYSSYASLSFEEALELEGDHLTPHEKCQSWSYDYSIFQSTLISEWDLVCDRQYQRSFVQSAFMVGVLIASPTGGLIADWKGRMPVIWVSLVGFLVVGTVITQVKIFYLYLALRFLIGLFGHCLYQTCYVLVLEWCVPKRRSLFGICFSLPFALGYMLLPIIAYFNRRYEVLQNYLGGIALLLFLNVFVLMESPRWLVLKGNYAKAFEVVAKSSKVNRQPRVDINQLYDTFDKIKIEKKLDKKASESLNCDNSDRSLCGKLAMKSKKCPQILSSPNLQKYTLVLIFDWVTNTMVYYGLSLNSGSFNFNPFLYMFLSGLVELPAYTIIVPIVAKYGRKIPVISSYILCGIFVLVSICIPKDFSFWVPLSLNMLGKLTITTAFQILYLYTSEIYPTSVRTQGIGITTMIGRLGAIGSPFIIDNLGFYFWGLPNLIFGSMSILAGLFTLALPETNNRYLPDTTQDVECFDNQRTNLSNENNIEMTIQDTKTIVEPEEEKMLSKNEEE